MTYAGGTRHRRKLEKKGDLIKGMQMQKPTQLEITSPEKEPEKYLKKNARFFSNNRSAPRRSFLSVEHRKSSSLRKYQTAQCLIRGLVHSNGHAGGRLFDSGSCL